MKYVISIIKGKYKIPIICYLMLHGPTRYNELKRQVEAATFSSLSKALKEQFDMDIEKNKIVQAEPIKSFGAYTVKAKLGYEVSGSINVLVVEE